MFSCIGATILVSSFVYIAKSWLLCNFYKVAAYDKENKWEFGRKRSNSLRRRKHSRPWL